MKKNPYKNEFLKTFIFSILTIIITNNLSAEEFEMTCKHSFQGNYSGGDVKVKYKKNYSSDDKAFIKGKAGWVEICSDVETHGKMKIGNLRVGCSIYLANWMNQRRKDFIWDFKMKELHVQTLWKIFNPKTNNKEWQWSYSTGELFTENWKVINIWESEKIEYKKSKCK